MHSKKSFPANNETTQTVSCRYFLKQLKRDCKKICRIKKLLLNTDSRGNRQLSPVIKLLTDNFHLFVDEYEECRKSLCLRCRIPCINGTSRISLAFANALELTDFTLSPKIISDILSEQDENYNLSLDEYFLSPALSRLAIFHSCKELLSLYYRQKTSDTLSKEDKYTLKLSKLTESLKCISTHNFETDILKGRIAKMLCQDPTDDFSKMTDTSKLMYLGMLSRKAKKQKISEIEFAKKLLDKCKKESEKRKRHIGYTLLSKGQYPKHLYFLFVVVLPCIITIGLMTVSPLFVLSLFPLWEAFRLTGDYIFPKFIKTYPMPRMALDEIPPNSATLVVITSVLSGETTDSSIFDNLERIFRANGENNVYFGVLADIKDSKSANAPGDEDVINHAYGRINSLCTKYGKSFILFERRRSYSKSEEVFMGWERKRGAVNELVMFLKDKETSFSDRSKTLAKDVLGSTRIKYVVTLDADTNLGLGAVRRMCGAMLHPLAIPVIDKNKGVVKYGYGIMQPVLIPELFSANATPFSKIIYGKNHNATHNLYQSIFSQTSYCGKGIFDVDAFYEVIIKNNTFPEDRILSHDILTGAKLRIASLSDMDLTESLPTHQLSYLKRLHRSIRGDIQNLAYIFPQITFSPKDVRDNNINLLSKFMLFDNVRRALVPLASLSCVFVAMLKGSTLGTILTLASLLYIAVPFILSLLSEASSLAMMGFKRQFFWKSAVANLRQNLAGMLFNLAMLPMLAYTCFDATSKSVYRSLISKKKLLEWQNCEESGKSNPALLMYVHRNIFSAFSAFLLFAFAPAGFLRALSILWFSFPIIAYHTSFERHKNSQDESLQHFEKSRKYAVDIWNFFKDTVTISENHLPIYRIEFLQGETVVHTTSPTNIGFYLLSVLCARDFGFITTDELAIRLSDTIATVEKLKKFKGHLYNRYDTKTLSVVSPMYISTADSGNFTACLITLRMGLRDYVGESTSLLEIIKRIEKIENSIDYTFLYNNERNLFSTGADIYENGNCLINSTCYDIMMCKARTISYIQCAKRLICESHWGRLSRELITRNEYIGLLSLSGTVSEYFSPHIFLPVFKGTIYDKTLQFAMCEQSKSTERIKNCENLRMYKNNSFPFDKKINFRYKRFEVPSLLLKDGTDKKQVLPYSCFLGLCANPKICFENLDAISKRPYYGKYGFYDAIDFTRHEKNKGNSTPNGYVSHHMGMSLCALCNCAFDNILQKRFMSDSSMNCASGLLQESIPDNATVRRLAKRNVN